MKRDFIIRYKIANWQYIAEHAVTVVFGAFWLYFLIPQGLEAIFKNVQIFSAILVIILATILLWSAYNLLRFRGKDRRKANGSVTIADLSAHFRVPLIDIVRWQNAKCLTLRVIESDNTFDTIVRVTPIFDTTPSELRYFEELLRVKDYEVAGRYKIQDI